jgi:hypothetical protein
MDDRPLDSATRQEFAERIKELEKEKAELLAPRCASRIMRDHAHMLSDFRVPRRSFGDRRLWLYDECSLESVRKIHGSCHKSHLEPGGMYFEGVEKAKRFRDSSPLERIEMRIGDERHAMNGLASIGAGA